MTDLDLDLEITLAIRGTATGELPDAVYAFRQALTRLLEAHGYRARTVKQTILRKRPASPTRPQEAP